MKVRVKVEMLAMVVVLFLTLGVSDGLVVNKCQLGTELNTTLPANLLDHITNLVAKIVCHVNLTSHFNTSAINYVSGPNVNVFNRHGHDVRKGRSAESSSEVSSEEDSNSADSSERRKRSASRSSSEESSKEKVHMPNRGFNSSTVNPVTPSKGNNSSSGKRHKGGRMGRSAESSSEESSEEDTDSSDGSERRKRSASRSSSEESSKEKFQVPNHGFNSSTINPVTLPKGNNSSSSKSHKGARMGRSSGSSTKEPDESSSTETKEKNMWTLYGLFQLPGRIACTSGFEPSLNLCSMDCDILIDDNIRDDITCLETILNKMLSPGNSNGPSKALLNKFHEDFFQKECSNAENPMFFSTC